MTAGEMEGLARVFEGAGVGWFISEPRDVWARDLEAATSAVEREIETAQGAPLVRSLSEELRSRPGPMKPLIQSFASPMTPTMRAMIYCVLVGGTIRRVRFEYEEKKSSNLAVTVGLRPDRTFTFESDEVWDVEALRHLGIMKIGEAPVIDGYYAFNSST